MLKFNNNHWFVQRNLFVLPRNTVANKRTENAWPWGTSCMCSREKKAIAVKMDLKQDVKEATSFKVWAKFHSGRNATQVQSCGCGMTSDECSVRFIGFLPQPQAPEVPTKKKAKGQNSTGACGICQLEGLRYRTFWGLDVGCSKNKQND